MGDRGYWDCYHVHVPTPLWAVTLRMFIGLDDIVLGALSNIYIPHTVGILHNLFNHVRFVS
jgi:hypothetical protein